MGNYIAISPDDIAIAARDGNLEQLRGLLDKHPSMIDRSSFITAHKSRSPLLIACANKHIDCVKMLVERGALLTFCDKNGRTALMIACTVDSPECVRLLLDAAFKKFSGTPDEITRFLNTVDDEDRTALMSACQMNSLSALREMIDWSRVHPGLLDVNFACSESRRTALLAACKYSRSEEIFEVLFSASPPPRLDMTTFAGIPPVVRVCQFTNHIALRHLLQRPDCPNLDIRYRWKSPNDFSSVSGYISALEEAIESNSAACINLLLHHRSETNPHGACADLTSDYGVTPLMMAISIARSNTEGIEAILDQSDIDLQNPLDGQSVVQMAILQYVSLSIVVYMITRRNANLHLEDNNGCSAYKLLHSKGLLRSCNPDLASRIIRLRELLSIDESLDVDDAPTLPPTVYIRRTDA